MGFGGSGGGGSLSGSSDVALNSPANNEVLTYDTSTSKWKNATGAVSTATQNALNAKAALSYSRPEIRATSSTDWQVRASIIPSGYTGPVVYESTLYLNHPAPTDMQNGDTWLERIS